jgi:flagellum-specific peptidoglycan hydrolase FlgJ
MTFILGPASRVSSSNVRYNLQRMKASPLFINEMFPVLWEEASDYNVDPCGVVAQSAKETGWGKFTGVLSAEWRNTCGLKVRDPKAFGLEGETDYERFAHQIFPNWRQGARAHVQHLIAYVAGDVRERDLVDPRYSYIRSSFKAGDIETFAELGGPGRWAAAPDYGTRIEQIILELSKGVPV